MFFKPQSGHNEATSFRTLLPTQREQDALLVKNAAKDFPFPEAQAAALRCPEAIWHKLRDKWRELEKDDPQGVKARMFHQPNKVFEVCVPLHTNQQGHVAPFVRYTGASAVFGFYLIPHELVQEGEAEEADAENVADCSPEDRELQRLFQTNGAEVLGDDTRLGGDLPYEEKAFLDGIWIPAPPPGQPRMREQAARPNDRCSKCGKKNKRCQCAPGE